MELVRGDVTQKTTMTSTRSQHEKGTRWSIASPTGLSRSRPSTKTVREAGVRSRRLRREPRAGWSSAGDGRRGGRGEIQARDCACRTRAPMVRTLPPQGEPPNTPSWRLDIGDEGSSTAVVSDSHTVTDVNSGRPVDQNIGRGARWSRARSRSTRKHRALGPSDDPLQHGDVPDQSRAETEQVLAFSLFFTGGAVVIAGVIRLIMNQPRMQLEPTVRCRSLHRYLVVRRSR